MEPLRTEILDNGNTVRIMIDNDPQDPRDWDNLGRIASWHRRYSFDERDHETLEGFDSQEFTKWLESTNAIYLPLYLYDHSTLAISTQSWIGRAQHAEWDSGQIGYIFVSLEEVREEHDWTRVSRKRREQIEKHLTAEVETLNQALTGTVLGYDVKDRDGEAVDSCWGFYGYSVEKLLEEIINDRV